MEFLGQIVLLRVENATVRHEDLAAWFNELDLDTGYLPKPTSPVNSFKKQATGTAGLKLTYDVTWSKKGGQATVQWEDESRDNERIVRRAMRTVRVQGKAGQSEVVAKVTFYKRGRRSSAGAEKMRFQLMDEKLDDKERPILEQWIKDTTARYDQGQGVVHTDALRTIARNYLRRRLKALPLRDGVYFVFGERREVEMKRLQGLVTRFGPECMFHPFELVDRDDHRALLGRAVNDELTDEAVKLQRDVQGLRGNHKRIPRARFAPLETRYEQLMQLAHDYAEAIGVQENNTLDRLTHAIVDARRSVR